MGRKAMPVQTLPHDIIIDVLMRLPAKSLMRFRCVCKLWHSLISDTRFVKMHLNRAIEDVNINCRRVFLPIVESKPQSIDFEAAADDDDDDAAAVTLDYPFSVSDHSNIEIVGSLNGLICLVVDFDNVILWNPSTRDAKKLSKPIAGPPAWSGIFGLGYDSSVDDYKVVRVPRSTTSGFIKIKVFTLKANSWRMIQDTYHPDIRSNWSITFLNGALHWLASNGISEDSFTVIISFDLATEKFRDVVPVPDRGFRSLSTLEFRVLGGYLSVLYFNVDNCEIWVMKEYGVKASWTKLFTLSYETVPITCRLSPLYFSRNEEVLMDVNGQGLIMYNIKEKTFRNLKIHGSPRWSRTVAYVESLVSPNPNNGIDAQHQAQKKRRIRRRLVRYKKLLK